MANMTYYYATLKKIKSREFGAKKAASGIVRTNSDKLFSLRNQPQ